MITASITETNNRLSELIKLCEVEDEIVIITRPGKPVAALIAVSSLGTVMGDLHNFSNLGGVDEGFARQVGEFIEQHRPALESLSKK